MNPNTLCIFDRFIFALIKELEENGYVHIPGEFYTESMDFNAVWQLTRLAEAVEPDAYDPSGTRHRLFGSLLFDPDTGDIVRSNTKEYYQLGFNPEEEAPRKFASIPDYMLANPALLELIRRDWRVIQNEPLWRNFHFKVRVNLHVISYIPTPNNPSGSSPPDLHQDGEPYTFSHTLVYENVVGGAFLVTPANDDKEILFRKTCTKPLETVLVRDCDVMHGVTQIEVAKDGWPANARRSVLLVDFTPLAPKIAKAPQNTDEESGFSDGLAEDAS